MDGPRIEANGHPYARQAPNAGQTAGLFAGRWASRLPLPGVESGVVGLFEDPRVDWALARLRELGMDPASADVLELGPLEGGHTFALSRAGVRSVTAVEAHAEAYLKCLVARELIGYGPVRFLLGDAMAFLRAPGPVYDVAFVCGFLYHMQDPVECLECLARRARALYVWTVHWDAEFAAAHPDRRAASDGVTLRTYHGRELRLHRHGYGEGIDYGKFWGGPDTHAHWMERADLEEVLRLNGFRRQVVAPEPNPNGAALQLAAVRDPF